MLCSWRCQTFSADSLPLRRLKHTQIYCLLCRVKTAQRFAMITEASPHVHQQLTFRYLYSINTRLANSFIYPQHTYSAFQVFSLGNHIALPARHIMQDLAKWLFIFLRWAQCLSFIFYVANRYCCCLTRIPGMYRIWWWFIITIIIIIVVLLRHAFIHF